MATSMPYRVTASSSSPSASRCASSGAGGRAPLALAGRRVAAQGQDVFDALGAGGGEHILELGAAGADTGQVCHRLQAQVAPGPRDDAQGALAGAAAGAIRYGDEVGR